MVTSLLSMKTAMDAVLAEAFQRDENFSNTLKEAFEQFINQRQNKCGGTIVKCLQGSDCGCALLVSFMTQHGSG